MLFYLQEILTVLGVCVALPVLIVWIVFRTISNRDNRQAEVVIKAIENNPNLDADRLIEAMRRPRRTYRQIQQTRLLYGCLFSLLGIAASIFAGIVAYNEPAFNIQYPAMMLAGLFLAIGIAFMVVYFVARKSPDPEGGES